MRDPGEPSRQRLHAFRAAAVALGVGVGLILSALIRPLVEPRPAVQEFRVNPAWLVSSDISSIPYLLAPNIENLTNSLGLVNGPDVTMEKPDGRFRILLIGDSVANSTTVAEGPIWPRLFPAMLEARLRSTRSEDIEVLNLSCSGLSLRQEIDLARSVGLRFQPDLILFAYTFNDLVETDIFDRRNMTAASKAALERYERQQLDWPHWYDDDSPYLAGLRETFADLGRFARRHPVALVGLPRLTDEAIQQNFLERVRHLAQRNGVTYLDILARLPVGELVSLRLNPRDDVHLGAEAHELYARALAMALGPYLDARH